VALASYNDLLAGIRDWLGRENDTANLPSTRLGDLVAFAEAEIYARLRVRHMEASADLTVSGQSAALPEGYIEMRRLYLDGTPLRPLAYVAPPQFWATFTNGLTGNPSAYTIEGENIVFGPVPDQDYTGKILYWRRLPALSTETNSLYSANPDLWLYGALSHAQPFIGEDARLATWRTLFENALARAQQQSDRDRYSGAPLRIRTG